MNFLIYFCISVDFSDFELKSKLNERLSMLDAAGAGLILCAVLLTISPGEKSELPRPVLLKGLLYSGSSVVLMAISIVWAKPALERTDVLWSTTLRILGGMGFLVLSAMLKQSRRQEVEMTPTGPRT